MSHSEHFTAWNGRSVVLTKEQLRKTRCSRGNYFYNIVTVHVTCLNHVNASSDCLCLCVHACLSIMKLFMSITHKQCKM